MKKMLLSVLGCCLLVLSTAAVSNAALVQWRSSVGGNDHWYEAVFSADELSWTAARSEAQSFGGYLATITSFAENNFIYGLIENQPEFWKAISGGRTYWGPWIGAYQEQNSQNQWEWKWVSGESFSYSNWDNYQSDPGVELYGHFHGSNRVEPKWNDLYDYYTVRGYILEYDTNPVPVPSALWLLGAGLLLVIGPGLRKRKIT